MVFIFSEDSLVACAISGETQSRETPCQQRRFCSDQLSDCERAVNDCSHPTARPAGPAITHPDSPAYPSPSPTTTRSSATALNTTWHEGRGVVQPKQSNQLGLYRGDVPVLNERYRDCRMTEQCVVPYIIGNNFHFYRPQSDRILMNEIRPVRNAHFVQWVALSYEIVTFSDFALSCCKQKECTFQVWGFSVTLTV